MLTDGLQNLYASVRFRPAPPVFSCSSLQTLHLGATPTFGLVLPHWAK